MSMKVSFSTLACPDWTMRQIIAMAAGERYDGIELRFVEAKTHFGSCRSSQGRNWHPQNVHWRITL